jgi:hypothetical protein
MLFPKFSENIAHRLCHKGKRSGFTDRGIVSGFYHIRSRVVANEIKIFMTTPLYDDFKRFNVTHRFFWLLLHFERIVFSVSVYINFSLILIQRSCVTEVEIIIDVSALLRTYGWLKASFASFCFKLRDSLQRL